MKSLKKMLAAGLAAATMVSVAACGNSSSSDAGTGSADNPVTIEVWGWEPLLADVKEALRILVCRGRAVLFVV